MRWITWTITALMMLLIQANAETYRFGAPNTYQDRNKPGHLFISDYPNGELVKSVYEHFHELPVKVSEQIEVKSGSYWRYRVMIVDEHGQRNYSHSASMIEADFRDAVKAAKGDVYDLSSGLIFHVTQPHLTSTWGKLNAQAGLFELEILDEYDLNTVLGFDIDRMKKQLDILGKVTLEGIFFDLDKATLKEESMPALEAAKALLMKHPELRLEIAGHTDNTGSDEYNMQLSTQRAQSVMTWLLEAGIDAERLTSNGYGESKPVHSNDSEAGRAKNRRVELVDISLKKKKPMDVSLLVRPYPRAKLVYQDVTQSSERFPVLMGEEEQVFEVQGSRLKQVFDVLDANGKRDSYVSGMQIKENYIDAIEEVGGEILKAGTKELSFRFVYSTGRITWGYLWAPNSRYTLIFLTEEPKE